MTANRIHDHDRFKLGLTPHNKTDDQLLEVRWKANTPPLFPPKFDLMQNVTAGLDENDRLGNCGPTSADNHRRIKTKAELGRQLDASLQQVLDLYTHSTNPPFNSLTGANDNGVTMPDLLNAMRKYGLGNDKIVAFGRLKDTSDASIYAAISIFKAVLFAVDLRVVQQGQSDQPNPVWDYFQSGDWGGHAVVAGAYDSTAGFIDVFSWATRIRTTAAFRQHQLDEVWVPIYQSTIDDTKDTVDYVTMASQFQSLTGQTLPGATPTPTPEPTPAPTPQPPVPDAGAAPFLGATDQVTARIQHSAAKSHLAVVDWLNKHFEHYFDL